MAVLGTWYHTPSADLLLVDVMSEQKTVPEQVDDVRMMYHQFRPVAIGVEKNGIGLASLQYLQVAGLPIYDVQADADMYSRAVSIAIRYKVGIVYLWSGAAYLDEYEPELLKFRKGSMMISWTWLFMVPGSWFRLNCSRRLRWCMKKSIV